MFISLFVSQSRSGGDRENVYIKIDLTAWSQAVIDGDSTNYGITVSHSATDAGATNNDMNIYAKEHATANTSPFWSYGWTTTYTPSTSGGDVITRSQGNVLHPGRGQSIQADRNKGKILSKVKKKGGN